MGVDEFLMFCDFWDELSARYPAGWQPSDAAQRGRGGASGRARNVASGKAKTDALGGRKVAKILESRLATTAARVAKGEEFLKTGFRYEYRDPLCNRAVLESVLNISPSCLHTHIYSTV